MTKQTALQSAATERALNSHTIADVPDPELWICYKRPDHIPAETDPSDWPGRYVARRFERSSDGNKLEPTEELKWSPTFAGLVAQLPPHFECYARTPEDHETVIQTRITRPRKPKFSPDIKLASGMTAGEAVRRAEIWWDRDGRRLIRADFNQERSGAKVKATAGAPAFKISPEIRTTLPSAVLRGLPWSMLNKREMLAVVQAWHQHFIMVPQIESQIAAQGTCVCPICKGAKTVRHNLGQFETWADLKRRHPEAMKVEERRAVIKCKDCGGSGKILLGLRMQ